MTDFIFQSYPALIYVLFPLGFFLLIKGADMLVDGAAAIALQFHVSELVIGLTIVSFGTSAPELVVNLAASFNDNPTIAIGNIIGSNIANILLILGVAAILYPLSVKGNTVWKEVPLSMLAVAVLAVLANDTFFDVEVHSVLSRGDGLILIFFFILFIYYAFGISKKEKKQQGEDEDMTIKRMSLSRSLLFIIVGLIFLILGGEWIVQGGVGIAKLFNMSEAFIAITVIAIGTSLPELAASVVAALKKRTDIAVGNAVGSNIFNIFWILGVSSFVRPIPFDLGANRDIFVAFLASFLLFSFFHAGKRHTIERFQGVIFLVTYFAYILYLLLFASHAV